MSAAAQTRPPWPDFKSLLARQMTPHIPDSAVAAARMIAVCQIRTHARSSASSLQVRIWSAGRRSVLRSAQLLTRNFVRVGSYPASSSRWARPVSCLSHCAAQVFCPVPASPLQAPSLWLRFGGSSVG